MHISALQILHSSHQDFEISCLWPYWKRTNKPGPWAASYCCRLQGEIPGRERRLIRELVANPGGDSLQVWLLASCGFSQSCRFFPFFLALFPSPELGFMQVHMLCKCKSAQLQQQG